MADMAYQLRLLLGDQACERDIPAIVTRLQNRGIGNIDDIASREVWELIDKHPSAHKQAQLEYHDKRMARARELGKLSKAELCALYRKRGHLWSAQPLEKWRKDEIINGIIDTEMKRPEPAEQSA